MSRHWTVDQALSLAPDPAAAKSAQGLASPRKWSGLGRDDAALWGLAQGSGAEPYQAQIDLSEPAFKCSCPSRKFPCKHGLGLLLLFAQSPNDIPLAQTRPEWVSAWLEKRAQRVAKTDATPASAPATTEAPDPAAQARRRDKRDANLAQGLSLLDAWLRDLVRQGLGSAAAAPHDFWEAPARRLIDAQAPGLARQVRALGAAVAAGPDQETSARGELARLHLLVSAGLRRAELPAAWRDEIDGRCGIAVEQETLRAGEGVPGPWLAGAQTSSEEDKLTVRTTYLFSPAGRSARFVEFSPSARPTAPTLAVGRWYAGDLVYYPGVDAERAIWKAPPRDAPVATLPVVDTVSRLLADHAAHLARNPLRHSHPIVARLTPARMDNRWVWRDVTGSALPMPRTGRVAWELMACSAGEPLEFVALWDGECLHPLALLTPEGVLDLSDVLH